MVSNYISKDDRCFICGNDLLHLLESHHIIPNRYGGSDEQFNRIPLCSNCHKAIERIYTDRVFERMGLVKESQSQEIDEEVDRSYSAFYSLSTEEKCRYLDRNYSDTKFRTDSDMEGRAVLDWAMDWAYDKCVEINNVTVGDGQTPEEYKRDVVKEQIRSLQGVYEDAPGAPEEEVINGVVEQDLPDLAEMDSDAVLDVLRQLRDLGDIYSPDRDHLRVV